MLLFSYDRVFILLEIEYDTPNCMLLFSYDRVFILLEIEYDTPFFYSFSIFFNSFSNLLRYSSPAMVRPNGKANQMPRMPKPQGKPRV